MSGTGGRIPGVIRGTSFAGGLLISLVAGYRLGEWLDMRLGTGPVFLVLGLLAGLALGLSVLFREVRRMGGK